MKNNNLLENSRMSDDKFLGFFDADGWVAMNIQKSRSAKSSDFSIFISYGVNQKSTRADLVYEVAKKFGGNVILRNDTASFGGRVSSEPGKKIRDLLKKTPPICPGRLHDFLLSEEIIKINERNTTLNPKEGLLASIIFAYNNKRNESSVVRTRPLQEWINDLNLSENELQAGKTYAKTLLKQIRDRVETHEQSLPTTTLSLDYVRGVHIGDGTLMVSLTWKPTSTNDRRRIEPIWAITNISKRYCQAFVHTFQCGRTGSSGKNVQKFIVSGADACFRLLHVFEDTWLPKYKQDQYQIFKEVLLILKAGDHFTEEGTIKIVNLVYGFADKGAREATRDELITWGTDWLRNKGYIK